MDCIRQRTSSNLDMAKKIGILGGTFDPVHFGHLRPALDVIEQLKLDQVRLIPCAVPPHKAQPTATARQRVMMLQLAIRGDERFVVDDRELHSAKPSYTVDTLVSLRHKFLKDSIYLFLGTDAFISVQTWNNWQRLLELTHIVVMRRPSKSLAPSDALAHWYQQHLVSKENQHNVAGSIWPVNVTQFAISATKIREKISEGLSLKFLIPDEVISLIEMLGLYRQNIRSQ